jgi:hypothetical protein
MDNVRGSDRLIRKCLTNYMLADPLLIWVLVRAHVWTLLLAARRSLFRTTCPYLIQKDIHARLALE